MYLLTFLRPYVSVLFLLVMLFFAETYVIYADNLSGEKQIEAPREASTSPAKFFPDDLPSVRVYSASDGMSLMSVSRVVKKDPPPPNPRIEFDLNQVAGGIHCEYISHLYLVRESEKVVPLTCITLSRGVYSNKKEREQAFDLDRGSRILDAYFDGKRLFLLFSFFDGQLYISTGEIDLEEKRVLNYSKVILLDLEHKGRSLFPAQSDFEVNDAGQVVARIRIASPDHQQPRTLKRLLVDTSEQARFQETLSATDYKVLYKEAVGQ